MAYVLQQLLSKSTKAYPEKPAVWARGKSITYRELDERSNQLAHLLRQRGIQKGDRVGLYFPKSVESLVAMFGILKAGAGYVPLDPEQPPARAAYIIGNCKMKGLVTDSLRLGRLDRETTGRLALRIVSGEPSERELGNSVSWES